MNFFGRRLSLDTTRSAATEDLPGTPVGTPTSPGMGGQNKLKGVLRCWPSVCRLEPFKELIFKTLKPEWLVTWKQREVLTNQCMTCSPI
jgi:hypothetical protein